jgi:hypothetical protein
LKYHGVVAPMEEQNLCKVTVVGSNPTGSTMVQ